MLGLIQQPLKATLGLDGRVHFTQRRRRLSDHREHRFIEELQRAHRGANLGRKRRARGLWSRPSFVIDLVVMQHAERARVHRGVFFLKPFILTGRHEDLRDGSQPNRLDQFGNHVVAALVCTLGGFRHHADRAPFLVVGMDLFSEALDDRDVRPSPVPFIEDLAAVNVGPSDRLLHDVASLPRLYIVREFVLPDGGSILELAEGARLPHGVVIPDDPTHTRLLRLVIARALELKPSRRVIPERTELFIGGIAEGIRLPSDFPKLTDIR